MSLTISSHRKLFRVLERLGLPLSGPAALISRCFDISRPHQHGIANNGAQVPTKISKNESVMLVGCGYSDKVPI